MPRDLRPRSGARPDPFHGLVNRPRPNVGPPSPLPRWEAGSVNATTLELFADRAVRTGRGPHLRPHRFGERRLGQGILHRLWFVCVMVGALNVARWYEGPAPPETNGPANSRPRHLGRLDGAWPHRDVPDQIVGWKSPEVDVLVVDDEDAVRTTMAEILRNEGYEVAEAANGEHALEALREATVGVILLDLHMPRLDGFEVLQRLRHYDPPVIVLSAAEPDLRPDDGGVTIHAVVRKPADPEDVLGAVAEVLGR